MNVHLSVHDALVNTALVFPSTSAKAEVHTEYHEPRGTFFFLNLNILAPTFSQFKHKEISDRLTARIHESVIKPTSFGESSMI